ncbi:MAG TPA: hypothetical protein VJQ51_02635 [Burkholderiales bacterium]|nr:hypothetical protein [Burkholderiales bacterium]
MKFGRTAEFLLVGITVVPAVLMFAGYPDLALINLIPIVFAALLSGVVDQVKDSKDERVNIDE